MEATKKTSERNRLIIEVSDSVYRLLTELAERSHSNLEDVLSSAIGLYGIAEEATTRGQELGIFSKGKMQKTIVHR